MTKVTTINMLLVKPDQLDAFITRQRQFASAMADRQSGLIGGRMYRSLEGSQTVLISQFESLEAQGVIMRSAEFAEHLATLQEMVESSSPNLYGEAYTYGGFK